MLTVAIQAGGRSSRMGRDKALIRLAGRPLIEHVLEQVRDLGDELLITTNRPADLRYLGYPLVGDVKPGAGALHGLHTALSHARGTDVLVVACDMPLIPRALLEGLIELRGQADVIVPCKAGRYEPLLAVYRREGCLPAIEAALARGEQRVISFYEALRVLTVKDDDLARLDPKGLAFFNINTPQDLARAETLLPRGSSDRPFRRRPGAP